MTNEVTPRKIQILRTIDKTDKIGVDGVIELLQKPPEEFGANLLPHEAMLIGEFLRLDKLESFPAFLRRASMIRNRFEMMAELERNVHEDGRTSWDHLLDMRENEDETWRDGGRPKNIAWALDDLVAMLRQKLSA